MVESTPHPNPFPGLRPFGAEETHLFFGREAQVAELLTTLRQQRFVAVVGTSGSGKSSLVRAGLIPALHGGTMAATSSNWEVAVLRPGGDPVRNLAQALLDADLYDAGESEGLPRVRATLERSRFGLVEAVRQSDVVEPGTNFLVVVDQFEELFRYRGRGGREEDGAEAFIRLLLSASAAEAPRIYVTITMRSDYLGECSQISGLAEAVNRGEYLIPRLTRNQLRDAIEKPVGVGRGRIAERLVQYLLNDVGGEQDQLPVLQHALLRTWDHWAAHGHGARGDGAPDTSQALDLDDYEAVGGMGEALSRHADEVFEGLTAETRVVAERLFKALTVKGADNRGIRRPTRLRDLARIVGASEDAVRRVVEAYRVPGVTLLMPGEPTELRADTVIDLSHESLMRVWTRLRGWVEQEAQSARIYARLAETAALHARGEAGLYHDPDLQVARSWREEVAPTVAWAEQYGGRFEPTMGFLDASQEAAEQAGREREAARKKELEQARALAEAQRLRAEEQRRSAVRLRWLAGSVAVVAVAAVVAFFLAAKAERAAQESSVRATDEAAAAERARGVAEEARAAAEVARGAAETARGRAEASAAELKRTLVLGDFGRGLARLEADDAADSLPSFARAVRQEDSFWPPGMRALATMAQRVFLTDDVHTLAQDAPIAKWHVEAKAQLVVTRDEEDRGFVWDATTGERLYALADGASVQHVRFTKRSTEVFGRVGDRIVGWKARTGIPLDFEIDASGLVESFQLREVTGGGWRIAGRFPDGLQVWDADTGAALTSRLKASKRLVAWELTPDGSKICAAYLDGVVAIWSAADGSSAFQTSISPARIDSLRISPDSAYVLVDSRDANELRWWPTDGVTEGGVPESGEPIVQLSFKGPFSAPRFLVSAGKVVLDCPALAGDSSSGHEITVHDLRSGRQLVKIEPADPVIGGPFFAGDGFSVVGCVLAGGRVAIWDLESGLRLSETQGGGESVQAQFSPDARRFVTRENGGVLRFYDTFSGAETAEPIRLEGEVNAWFFGPEGERFFASLGSDAGTVRIWDSRRGVPLSESLGVASGFFGGMLFLPDHLRAVSSDTIRFSGEGGLTRGVLPIWNTDTATLMTLPLEKSGGAIRHAEYAPDGARVVVVAQGKESGRKRYCTIWDTRERELVRRFDVFDLNRASFNRSGQRVVTASGRRRATVWDVASGRLVVNLPHERGVLQAQFSPDDARVLSASQDSFVWLWDLATGTPVAPPLRLEAVPVLLSYTEDGSRIVLLSRRSRLVVLDAGSFEVLEDRVLLDGKRLWLTAASLDGEHISVHPEFSQDVHVIEVASGRTVQTLGHGTIPRSARFSPDGRLLASGTGSNPGRAHGNAYLRDWKTGRDLIPMLRANAWVGAVAFSADGELLAAGTRYRGTGTLHVWHTATGKPVLDPIELTGPVEALEFRSDGEQIFVRTRHAASLVDLPPRSTPLPPVVPELAEAVAGKRLTDSLGGSKPIERSALAALRKEAGTSRAEGRYADWVDWLLADRAERSVAPGVEQTRAELVRQLTHSSAEADLQRALRLAPADALAYARMGDLLGRSSKVPGADKPAHRSLWLASVRWYIARAKELAPESAEVHAYEAEVLSRAGLATEARRAAERAVELDAESPNALYLDAVTAASQGDWTQAHTTFQRALAALNSSASTPAKYLSTTAPPLIGVLADLAPQEVWGRHRQVHLPNPIDGTFEDFELVPEGELPAGWSATEASTLTEGDGRWDLSDLDSAAYDDWVVVSRERLRSTPRYGGSWKQVLRALGGFASGQGLQSRFLHAEASQRDRFRTQILITKDFDLSAASGVHVAFRSAYVQDRNSISAVEYSTDRGATWLPIVYRLDANAVERDAALAVDAVQTFEREDFERPRGIDASGRFLSPAFARFIGAEVHPDLAPYIESATDEDPKEYQRHEVFRLPAADRQSHVRLRFLHTGMDAWYWSIDDFGLYAFGEEHGVEIAPTAAARALPQAADPRRLLQVAAMGLDPSATPSTRTALGTRLLLEEVVRQSPASGEALATYAWALAHSGAIDEAVAVATRVTERWPGVEPFWELRGQLFEKLGGHLQAQGRAAAAALCFEILDALFRHRPEDIAAATRLAERLVALGRLKEAEVLFPRGSFWKYLDEGSDQGTAWRSPDYDDSSWAEGPAPLGYGDRPRTRVGFGTRNNKHPTTYFRAAFELEQAGAFRQLLLRLRRDDGAVVYLNGEEIVRSAMPAGPVAFRTYATETASSADERRFYEFRVPPDSLRAGRNVLAVEVHQVNATSSDLSFDLELAGIALAAEKLPAREVLERLEGELGLDAVLRAVLWAARARLFLAVGDTERFDEALEVLASLDPAGANVPWLRARQAYLSGDFDAAGVQYDQALRTVSAPERSRSDAKSLFLLGALREISKSSETTPRGLAQAARRVADSSAGERRWELDLLARHLEKLASGEPEVHFAQATLLGQLGKYEEALSRIDAALADDADHRSRASRSRRRALLELRFACLRGLGRGGELDAARPPELYPPRPQDPDAKLVDLTEYYNGSLYDGSQWTSDARNHLSLLPETFVAPHGVDFDLRGVIALNSGPFERVLATGKVGDTFNERLGHALPHEITGISIDQTATAIHFLTSTNHGEEMIGVEVARFVFHYDDGTEAVFPLRFGREVADWNPRPGKLVIPDSNVGWRGRNNVANHLVLSELVWQNPYPGKTIRTLDFVSAKKQAAPFLIAITLH